MDTHHLVSGIGFLFHFVSSSDSFFFCFISCISHMSYQITIPCRFTALTAHHYFTFSPLTSDIECNSWSGLRRTNHITSCRFLQCFAASSSTAGDLRDGDACVELLHDEAPWYLADPCVPLASIYGHRQSRSHAYGAFLTQRTRTSTGQRSFDEYRPRIWNTEQTCLQYFVRRTLHCAR